MPAKKKSAKKTVHVRATKKVTTKKAAGKTAAAARPQPRADFGAPIDDFLAKQPPQLRAILDALRALIEEAAPDAQASLKWGMPFYSIGGQMMCGTPAHKAHVNLILAGPANAFADPDNHLSGEGKTGRHLKLTTLADLPPKPLLRTWLRTAAKLAHEAEKN